MDRLFLAAGGFERGCHTIGHLEEVLFHGTFGTAGIGLQGPAETSREKAEDEQNPWEEYRTAAESAKLSVELAAKAAEEARELFARELRVSVIIPSKDNPSVLGKCLRSLTQRPEGSVPVEILLIDNGSNEENRKKQNSWWKKSGQPEHRSGMYMSLRSSIFPPCVIVAQNWQMASCCCS